LHDSERRVEALRARRQIACSRRNLSWQRRVPPAHRHRFDPFVIEADPEAVLEGALIFPPATGGSYIEVGKLVLRPGTRPAIDVQGNGSSPYWSHLTFGVVIDRIPSSGATCLICVKNYPDALVFDGITITNGGTRVPGVNALALYGKNHKLLRSFIRDVGGHIILSSSVKSTVPGEAAIEVAYNWFEDILCDATTDGDGCIQGYNTWYHVHHNVARNVGSNASSVYGFANSRKTSSTSVYTRFVFEHNTLIGPSPKGGDQLNRGVELSSATVDDADVHSNIFMGGLGSASDLRGAAFRCRGWPLSWSATNPVTQKHDHSLYFGNVRDLSSSATECPGFTHSCSDRIGEDPVLDSATLVPIPGSPVCGNGRHGTDIGAIACNTPSPGDVNQPPTVNVGADQTISLPNVANLDGTISDDGQPVPPGALTTSWSLVSGPGTVTFGNAIDTIATFSAAGGYILRLTTDDGALSVSDDVAITVSAANGERGRRPDDHATSVSEPRRHRLRRRPARATGGSDHILEPGQRTRHGDLRQPLRHRHYGHILRRRWLHPPAHRGRRRAQRLRRRRHQRWCRQPAAVGERGLRPDHHATERRQPRRNRFR